MYEILDAIMKPLNPKSCVHILCQAVANVRAFLSATLIRKPYDELKLTKLCL